MTRIITQQHTKFLVAIGLVLVTIGGLPLSAMALTISPVKMEISGDPGQTLNGVIDLLNEESEDKVLYSSTANFEARGESGSPYFLPATGKGLSSWIDVTESVTLRSGEKKSIPFTINVPKDAEAGGHFAVILWGNAPPQQAEGGQVAIGGKLGMLVLLSVTGDAKQGGGLLDFIIKGDQKVLTSLPVAFSYRFSNDGRERIKPAGELKIKNLFGLTTVALEANRRDGNVLPGSARKFEVVWFEKGQDKFAIYTPPLEEEEDKKIGFFETAKKQWQNFALGPYKAELNLAYGKDSNVAKADLWFYVIPWQLLLIIILVLTISGFAGMTGIKKYNRWIIAKANR